jgi:hypothetical protein
MEEERERVGNREGKKYQREGKKCSRRTVKNKFRRKVRKSEKEK